LKSKKCGKNDLLNANLMGGDFEKINSGKKKRANSPYQDEKRLAEERMKGVKLTKKRMLGGGQVTES